MVNIYITDGINTCSVKVDDYKIDTIRTMLKVIGIETKTTSSRVINADARNSNGTIEEIANLIKQTNSIL